MSKSNRITSYSERRSRITTHIEVAAQRPVYPQWTTIASKCSVRAVAVASHSRHVWVATWGGVIAWNVLQEYYYQRYSSEHGLCGNAVACICVDNEDHPWTGHTEGGIAYFDGQRWMYHCLQHQPVRAICAAQNSSGIWAADDATIYSIAAWSAAPEAISPPGHLAAMETLALLDTGERLLVGNAFGLYHIQKGQEPVQITPELIQSCTALVRDRNGTVWVGTREGVFALDGEQVTGPLLPEQGENTPHVLSLAASRDALWVLTSYGISSIVNGTWSQIVKVPEPAPALQALAAHNEETTLWIGTDRLLALLQPQRQGEPIWNSDLLPSQPEDQLHNLGRCILPQKFQGSVWIGTAGELVECESTKKWMICTRGGDVQAISTRWTKTGKTLWGLVWPYGIGRWRSYDWVDFGIPQPSGIPVALATGLDGHLYALAGPALWRLTLGEAQKIAAAPSTIVRCPRQTSDGQWWIGTNQGVYRLSAGEWELAGEYPGPLQSGVRALEVIGEELWAATETGLWKHHKGAWEVYSVEQGEGLQDVRALTPSIALKGLWLARHDRLVLYDPLTQRQVQCYTTADSGLASSRVTALAEIEDVLWIATYAGICCLRLG